MELSFEQAFGSLAALLESRSIPVLVADDQFGSIRSDWTYFEPGEVDLTRLAECHLRSPARRRAAARTLRLRGA